MLLINLWPFERNREYAESSSLTEPHCSSQNEIFQHARTIVFEPVNRS